VFKRFFFLSFLFFLFGLLYSCENKKEAPKAQPQMKEIPVTVFKMSEPKEVAFEMIYPGKTKSPAEVKVVARVTGFLQKRFFKEGAYVKKGELLFLIEQDPYLAQFEMAKAQVEKAQAELNRAERDWKRISEAVKVRLVSESERDKALSDLETAKARLKEAKANLRQAELNLKYTEVRAEISGIVGKREIDEGNLVTPGTLLTTITQIDPLYVEFSLPERDFELLGFKGGNYKKLKGVRVEILYGEKEGTLTGIIDFVDSKLDETSSLKVRALVSNPKGILLPQTFVRVKIKGFPRKALLIPQKAVMQGPQGAYVFVVEEGKAKMRPLVLGNPIKDFYVVEKGITPGDLVVLDNLVKIRPEMKIKIEKTLKGLP